VSSGGQSRAAPAGDAGSCGAACRRVIAAASNSDKRVIDAIAVVFKDERARLGIQMKPE
jgi:hypothetical protein